MVVPGQFWVQKCPCRCRHDGHASRNNRDSENVTSRPFKRFFSNLSILNVHCTLQAHSTVSWSPCTTIALNTSSLTGTYWLQKNFKMSAIPPDLFELRNSNPTSDWKTEVNLHKHLPQNYRIIITLFPTGQILGMSNDVITTKYLNRLILLVELKLTLVWLSG